MASIVETYTWDVVETELKAHLGILDASGDVRLKRQLLAATRAADTYIDSEWIDDDGEPIEIPDDVKEGVFEWIRFTREIGARKLGLQMEKVDDLQTNYSVTGTERSPGDRVAIYWWPHKDIVIY